jgi:adenylate cyclase
MILQEVEATVVVADVRGFSTLSQQMGPVELGILLSRFYEHMGDILRKHQGRIVKYIGDGLLGVFIGGPNIDHRGRALRAIAEAVATRQGFIDELVKMRLPMLDYAIGAASGTVLAGELGTDYLRFWDVLGRPVNDAFRLTALATRREVSNLVAADTYEHALDKAARPAAVETDMVELAAEKLRLFRVEG